MAKEKTALKKGKASFNLIGKVKLTDKTFTIDNTYGSGWTDNSMYVGVDCGMGNVVYAEMRGGFFPDKNNIIYAYDKSNRDENGRSEQVEIAWEDRLDETWQKNISDSSFLTVGIEKDVRGKTVYKKFLSAYDAVAYLNEYLRTDMIVNVKGNIKYSEYDGDVFVNKEITSIVLSRIEDENDFKAVFSQTILLDSKSIGSKNAEKNTIELNAYVVDYVGKVKIDNEKVVVKKNVVYPKTFEVAINENPDITAKMLQKFFKAKKGNLIEITVTGKLAEGGNIVNVTSDDIPDDIKELIDMGLYSMEEAESVCAVGNGSRERRMIILKPDIVYVGDGENRKPTIAFDSGKYTENDLYFYEQALCDAGVNTTENFEEVDDDENPFDDDLLSILDNI